MALPRALIPVASAVLVFGSLAACSGDDERPGGPAVGGTSGSGGSGASGGGGSGASGGSSGSGGASGNAGSGGSAGSAGSSGSAGSGGVGTDGGPIDEACTSNAAFRATGAAFVFPTAQALAQELSALTYDYSAHPLTVVLAAKPGGVGFIAVSATEANGGLPTFPAGKQPELVPAAIAAGGFWTATPQINAWLRVVDQSGPKDIALENLELNASTGGKCSTISATVSATIPPSQGSLSLDLPGGAKTISELAGPTGGGGQAPDGGTGYPLKLVFAGESTDFDFASLGAQ